MKTEFVQLYENNYERVLVLNFHTIASKRLLLVQYNAKKNSCHLSITEVIFYF